MDALTHLSLFTGIGGLDLGLERAGMVTVGQVEIDPACRLVLARHWPDVPRHNDVRTAVEWLRQTGLTADVVSGGFPCQPFSPAGKGKGAADPRHLWPSMMDVIEEVRPRYVIGENSPRLLRHSAFRSILADLSQLRYVVEWSIVSACAMGAPHMRKRLFIVGYPDDGSRGIERNGQEEAKRHVHHWQTEPEPHPVAYGISRRVERRRLLANAVVPQVAEYVGRLVIEHNNP